MKTIAYILFILLTTLISNAEENCCEEDAKRILEQFEKYEPVYIELYKENIRDHIKGNPYFIDKYEDIDNFPLDSMEFFIIPTLKWNEKALNYQEGESICSYIDLDTVLFTSRVSIYWDSSFVAFAN